MHGLLDKLGEAVSTGNLNNIKETLQHGLMVLMELFNKIASEKSKEVLSKVIEDTSALIQKLSSGEGSLDDVHAFIENGREKIKERLAAKIKEATSH